jgi:outer membrane protein assembly factor BamD (BamD/ComL family)
MRKIAQVVMIVAFVALSGCSENNVSQLFETAKFEELQNNKEHAVQLYEEIITKHPQSEFIDKAKERLAVLKANK